jgi:hypothetical protein
MSHITCPKCGSNEHTTGYGFAGGPLGGYTFCDGCSVLLELFPDLDGLTDEQVERVTKETEKDMREIWGDKYERPHDELNASNTTSGTQK